MSAYNLGVCLKQIYSYHQFNNFRRRQFSLLVEASWKISVTELSEPFPGKIGVWFFSTIPAYIECFRYCGYNLTFIEANERFSIYFRAVRISNCELKSTAFLIQIFCLPPLQYAYITCCLYIPLRILTCFSSQVWGSIVHLQNICFSQPEMVIILGERDPIYFTLIHFHKEAICLPRWDISPYPFSKVMSTV